MNIIILSLFMVAGLNSNNATTSKWIDANKNYSASNKPPLVNLAKNAGFYCRVKFRSNDRIHTANGYLLGVDDSAIYLFKRKFFKEKIYRIMRDSIKSISVDLVTPLSRRGANLKVVGRTLFGILISPTQGIYLIITVPAWIISGTFELIALKYAHYYIGISPKDIQSIRKYSIFYDEMPIKYIKISRRL